MNYLKRLDQLFVTAPRLPLAADSKIVLFSDCHRGDGSQADDFARNQNLYFYALSHYERSGFTYIELGDGDELWENKRLADIVEVHSHVYWLLGKLHRQKRLHMLYGNHDMVKKNKGQLRALESCYDERTGCTLPLCPNLTCHEALVLEEQDSRAQILLVHGHQVDFLNYDLWRLARFLVRYLWRPLELLGFNDPTSAGKNYRRRDGVERRLIEWVKKDGQMLVAGHTHRPVFPLPDEPPYFNDGSCVHPRCITCLEIEAGQITLAKWTNLTKNDGTLYVGREVLEGPQPLQQYLQAPAGGREVAQGPKKYPYRRPEQLHLPKCP